MKNSNKNEKQKMQSEKLTENKPLAIPPISEASLEKRPFGKGFEFFYYRFMRVL